MRNVRAWRSGIAWLLFVGVVASCSDTPTTSPTGTRSHSASSIDAADQPIHRVAVLLAAALADSGARQELNESMRASKVKEGKLHLPTYLRNSGSGVLDRMADAGGMTTAQVLNLLRSIPEPVELYLPVPAHRAGWRGGEDVLVAAQMREDAVPFGVDVTGDTIELNLAHPPSMTTLAVVPAESFGAGGVPLKHHLRRRAGGVDRLGYRTNDMCMESVDRVGTAGCEGGGGGGTGGGDGGSSTRTWQRGIGVTEYIEYMRTPNDHEPWVKGAPEFSLLVVGTSDTDSHAELNKEIHITEDTWNGSDDDLNAQWNAYEPSAQKLITWDTDYGTRVRIECWERDAKWNLTGDADGETTIFDVNTYFSGSFHYENSDDFCGRDYITPRLSTGEWTRIPDNDPKDYDIDGTSDLQWYGFGLEL